MKVRSLISLSLVLTLLLNTPGTFAKNAESRPDSPSNVRAALKNVQLDFHGNLLFAVVDSAGRRVSRSDAIVVIGQKPVKVRSNAEGMFVVPVIKGGTVVIIHGDYSYGCRVWKQGTAPPESLQSIAFVQERDAAVRVRGQALGSALRATERAFGLAILALGGVAAWQAISRDNAS